MNTPIERQLKKGWYIYWQNNLYLLDGYDIQRLVLDLTNLVSLEHEQVALASLLLDENLQFAPTLEDLLRQRGSLAPDRFKHTVQPVLIIHLHVSSALPPSLCLAAAARGRNNKGAQEHGDAEEEGFHGFISIISTPSTAWSSTVQPGGWYIEKEILAS